MIKIRDTDHMEYMEGMEKSDHSIMNKVLKMTDEYDYRRYNAIDVKNVLNKETIGAEDLAVLLSPSAEPLLEKMARRAKIETAKHFGNTVCMFTPLYIANYCENYCVYCGFNCSNKIRRGKLSIDEIESEYKTISETGLREILLLTGESKSALRGYIAEAVSLAKIFFYYRGRRYILWNSDEYADAQKGGRGFCQRLSGNL